MTKVRVNRLNVAYVAGMVLGAGIGILFALLYCIFSRVK